MVAVYRRSRHVCVRLRHNPISSFCQPCQPSVRLSLPQSLHTRRRRRRRKTRTGRPLAFRSSLARLPENRSLPTVHDLTNQSAKCSGRLPPSRASASQAPCLHQLSQHFDLPPRCTMDRLTPQSIHKVNALNQRTRPTTPINTSACLPKHHLEHCPSVRSVVKFTGGPASFALCTFAPYASAASQRIRLRSY